MYENVRGIRNNNPGNIERNNIVWKGMSKNQTDPRFIVFDAPEWGIRAMGKILRNYQRLHGLKTIRGIINRWAPPVENETTAYVKHAADGVGVSPDSAVDLNDHETLVKLIKVIIKHENGFNPYFDETINKGIAFI